MFRQKIRRSFYAFITIFLVTHQTVWAAEVCIHPLELEADQVRFVETQLRVAALQCRSHDAVDFTSLYGGFVKENRPYLVKSSKPLRTFLARQGQQSIDNHVVATAKRISFESAKVAQFCARAKLAAQFSAKSAHPVMLISMMPVRYQKPAMLCTS